MIVSIGIALILIALAMWACIWAGREFERDRLAERESLVNARETNIAIKLREAHDAAYAKGWSDCMDSFAEFARPELNTP